jgi:glycosyltransferase involved in cell wall biosynthesis
MSKVGAKKKSILFVYTSLSTFVNNDLSILSSTHVVEKYHFAPVKGIAKNSLQIFKQLIFLLIFGWKFDLFYCWFADYHSYLPVLFAKIFRKKSVVVIGGYDVCRIRKLKYGAFCTPFRGWFCRSSMRMASCILPVSGHVDRKAKAIAPLTKRKMIYNCVTFDGPEVNTPFKTDTILTVGLINNERTFFLKGIDTFIETARILPELKFEIVGINKSRLAHKLGNLPVNLTLYDKVKPEELKDFYQKAKIYCQFSRSESFGVSIAEAMIFGAFPIVTREGGMPEVIGTVGSIIERDPQLIAGIIRDRILKEGDPDKNAIRKQVTDLFSYQKRTESLLNLIDTV